MAGSSGPANNGDDGHGGKLGYIPSVPGFSPGIRESLYKTSLRNLSAGAHPRFETINSVLHALGVKFVVVAERES